MTTETKPTGEPSTQPSDENGPWNMPTEKLMAYMGNPIKTVTDTIKETVAPVVEAVKSYKPWEMSFSDLQKLVTGKGTQEPAKPAGEAYKASTEAYKGIKQGLYHTPEKITPALQKLKDLYDNKLIPTESGGKHYNEQGGILTSPKGAEGAAQIMPKTQANPGFGVEPAKDKSPEESLRTGFDYMVAMESKYNGDMRKALAAYNYGPGKVDKIIRESKKAGTHWESRLPKETRDYLQKIAGK